jgi:hypothetical protein
MKAQQGVLQVKEHCPRESMMEVMGVREIGSMYAPGAK